MRDYLDTSVRSGKAYADRDKSARGGSRFYDDTSTKSGKAWYDDTSARSGRAFYGDSSAHSGKVYEPIPEHSGRPSEDSDVHSTVQRGGVSPIANGNIATTVGAGTPSKRVHKLTPLTDC